MNTFTYLVDVISRIAMKSLRSNLKGNYGSPVNLYQRIRLIETIEVIGKITIELRVHNHQW